MSPWRTTLIFLLTLRSSAVLHTTTAVRFAVTDLFLVSADSLDAAVEICETNPRAQAVGIDWGNANAGRVLQLCVKREQLPSFSSSSSSSSSSSLNASSFSSPHVVQRVAVYTDRAACLASESELFRPKDGVIVCVKRSPSSAEVLFSGNFLSDLWVSTDKNYNSDLPGWSSIPSSVLEPADGLLRSWWQWLWYPAYRGAFISFQKPLVAIREVKLVTTAAEETADACATLVGEAWERAGSAALNPEDDGDNRSVLCVRRGDVETSDKVAAYLTAVSVIRGVGATCGRTGEGMTQRLPLPSADISLCLSWSEAEGASSAAHEIIVDLRLEDSDEDKLLGQFERVSQLNVNAGHSPTVYLYAQRNWKSVELVDEDAKLNGLTGKPPLVANVQASSSGLSFKILQIADLHYSGDPTTRCNDVPLGMKSRDCSEALMTQFVNELLDLEKPDFVAFTGDNVQVYDRDLRQAAIDIVTQGVEARGIPFAVIFGNHDDQKGFSRAQMMEMLVKKPHAYARRGPVTVDGVGNYEIGVQAPQDGAWGRQGSDVFRMYFVDSHAYPDESKTPHHVSKYDWIKPNQVAFYRQLAQAHAAQNNSVPAVMFFHIPLPEYALDAKSLRSVGDHNEGVQSSGINMNLFGSLVELGEVKATFCGHDHVNDYCYKRDGVQLCYGGGVGFGKAYGWRSYARRARVIEWSVDAQNQRTIRSWRRIFGDTSSRQLEEVLYAEQEPAAAPSPATADAV